MRRRAPLILLCLALLAAFLAYVAWAAYAGAQVGSGWKGLPEALPFLLAGVATVAAVIFGFARLAVHSARKGYDERAVDDKGPFRR